MGRWSLWLLLIVASGAEMARADAPSSRPNLVVVLADNVGQDWFGCYGSDEKCTPRIDRLAAEGVRFRHCYVTPLCSTTRAEFYTGRYGFRTGWHTHHDAAIYGGGGFDWNRETTWARVLRDGGYATAITGKWQINDLSVDVDALDRHGFSEHLVWTGMLEGSGDAEQRWKASIALGGNRELESRYWDPINYRNGKREQVEGRFGPDVYVDYLIDFMKTESRTTVCRLLRDAPGSHSDGDDADRHQRECYGSRKIRRHGPLSRSANGQARRCNHGVGPTRADHRRIHDRQRDIAKYCGQRERATLARRLRNAD